MSGSDLPNFSEEERSEWTERFRASAEYLNRQFYLGRIDLMDTLHISISQGRALLILQQNGPIRMRQLADALDRTISATTSIADRLVRNGLITRQPDPNDRRAVICKLTDRGHHAIAVTWSIDTARISKLCKSMCAEQLTTAVLGLETIQAAETHAAHLADAPTAQPLSQTR